ncbi:MAG: hypothetical protein LBH06_06765 [Rikenellaceae bacterium]|jgi:hypothetical protein|nr:hypothetical protein [Rikenellaceae bacterium]
MDEESFDAFYGDNPYLMKVKSRFFKKISEAKQVEQIEVSSPHMKYQTLIKAGDFQSCILYDAKEVSTNTEAVRIYIIAPILDRGRKDSWKGIYDNIPIDFKIQDKNFKNQVDAGYILFRNGSYIDCELEITTIETTENSIKPKYNVLTIIGYGDDNNYNKVLKKKRKDKTIDANDDSTLLLFDDNSYKKTQDQKNPASTKPS